MATPFDEHGNFTGAFPEGCIADCSAPGSVDEAVAYWRKRLQFEVPRERAIRWLREFGAWTDAEMQAWDDVELAERVLWLACCDIRESGDWFGLVH